MSVHSDAETVDRYGDIRINNAFGLTVGVSDGESVRSGCAQSCIYMGPLAPWSQAEKEQ
jgi:hypothetical protein